MKCITSTDKKFRYVLQDVTGPNPLICIGINPSTATHKHLDLTTTIVRNFVLSHNEYDGWIMLNIYPQYATYPKDISNEINKIQHQKNLKHIKKILQLYPNSDIWLAFGNSIFKRKFLKDCTKDILKCISRKNTFCRGTLNSTGCPHHPLVLSSNEPLKKFNIQKFLEKL